MLLLKLQVLLQQLLLGKDEIWTVLMIIDGIVGRDEILNCLMIIDGIVV